MTRHQAESESDSRKSSKRVAILRRDTPARLIDPIAELIPTAPNLLLLEIVVLQICAIVITVLALSFDAPLETIADPLRTPNPAKAAWYFLGLQELLHYFPPVVAGVLLPGLILLGLAVIPYVRVNWELEGFYDREWKLRLLLISVAVLLVSLVMAIYHAWPVIVPLVVVWAFLCIPALSFTPPELRRRLGRVPLSDWIMTWFVAEAVVLTLIGVLFRGPGWGWTWPWIDGIF